MAVRARRLKTRENPLGYVVTVLDRNGKHDGLTSQLPLSGGRAQHDQTLPRQNIFDDILLSPFLFASVASQQLFNYNLNREIRVRVQSKDAVLAMERTAKRNYAHKDTDLVFTLLGTVAARRASPHPKSATRAFGYLRSHSMILSNGCTGHFSTCSLNPR